MNCSSGTKLQSLAICSLTLCFKAGNNEKLIPLKLKLHSTAFFLSQKRQNSATKRHELVMEISKASNEAFHFLNVDLL